jgi:hypothetical protein
MTHLRRSPVLILALIALLAACSSAGASLRIDEIYHPFNEKLAASPDAKLRPISLAIR